MFIATIWLCLTPGNLARRAGYPEPESRVISQLVDAAPIE